jgi:hypothetical protein
MNKKIKVVASPFNPSLEIADKIVVKLHVPYSVRNVTVQICPNVQEYVEKADTPTAKIRQVSVTTPTDQTATATLTFDLESNKKKSVTAEGTDYEIELLGIGKEEIQGQQFPFFEFNVSWG